MSDKMIPKDIKNFILNYKHAIIVDDVIDNFNISRKTASNYLSRLYKEGLISRTGRGRYVISKISKNKPDIPKELEEIHNLIKKNSPYLDFVIWSIFNLKSFYHYIPSKNYIFIEAQEMYELEAIREMLFEFEIESIINPNNKKFQDLFYRSKTPVFLFKRKNPYGIIEINGIQTPILERCIIDLYYYITKKKFSYPLEEVREILINLIKTEQFNFSFVDRYARIRSIEFEINLIFSIIRKKYPNLVPEKYTKRIDKIRENLKTLFGDNMYHGIL